MFDPQQNAKEFEQLLQSRASQMRVLRARENSQGVLTIEPHSSIYFITEAELINAAGELNGNLFTEHIVDFVLPALHDDEIAIAYITQISSHIAVLAPDNSLAFHAVAITFNPIQSLAPLIPNKRFWNRDFGEGETIMSNSENFNPEQD